MHVLGAIKRGNPELIAIYKQLKLPARDGKSYLTDAINDGGVNIVIAMIPILKLLVLLNFLI